MMLRKLSAFVAALLVTAITPAQAGSFSALYAFGDSLSDAGNVYIATGGAMPASPPYYLGEFSNGPNWVEDLSKQLGLGPVFPSLPPFKGNDYAWGDATTGFLGTDNPASTVPTGLQQVGTFLTQHGYPANPAPAPANALYTVTLGGNDVINILTQLQNGTISGPTAQAQALAEAQGAAQSEATGITDLHNAGAKTFIVALVGDVGKSPEILAQQDPVLAAEATTLSLAYNSALVSDLSGMAGVHFLNTIGLLNQVEANPLAYGFTDLTDPCYTGSYTGVGGTVCANPNAYLFWDNVHPSAAADVFIADAAAALLAPSPTPGAGLVSLGVLILVGLMRKAPELLARLSGI